MRWCNVWWSNGCAFWPQLTYQYYFPTVVKSNLGSFINVFVFNRFFFFFWPVFFYRRTFPERCHNYLIPKFWQKKYLYQLHNLFLYESLELGSQKNFKNLIFWLWLQLSYNINQRRVVKFNRTVRNATNNIKKKLWNVVKNWWLTYQFFILCNI